MKEYSLAFSNDASTTAPLLTKWVLCYILENSVPLGICNAQTAYREETKMAANVVGWILQPSETCEPCSTCGENATCYVSVYEGADPAPSCDGHVPAGARDLIAEAFAKAVTPE